MKRTACLLAFSALMLGLGACSERPQELAGRQINGGAPNWQGPASPFTAPGWTVGDRRSWQTHMQTRAQAQNEYVRLSQSH